MSEAVVHGKVYFIGAGPGDPELITVKGARLVARCPVVIYAGSLVNPQVLRECRKDADIYDSASMNLDEIVDVMAEAVAHGDDVARVHTGDPALFGAIHEQILELRDRGIEYDVIPGVSSLFGAAAALERELTQPEVTQTVIISRIEGRTPVPKKESLASLAMHGSTLALFLSISEIERVVGELVGPYPIGTPVAVVARATWPDEQIIRGTLEDIAAKVKKARITKTALILVGQFLADGDAKSKLYDRKFSHGYRRAKGEGMSPEEVVESLALKAKDNQFEEVAVVGLTAGGLRSAAKVAAALANEGRSVVVYGPESRIKQWDKEGASNDVSVRALPGNTAAALPLLLREHKKLVTIMSLGIVVRMVGPYLMDKKTDGAVVVADEALENFVSVVGGHLGGANELARGLSTLLGGRAVITTSSDSQGLPAIDMAARELGLIPESGDTLTRAAAAIVNGEAISCYSDLPEIASRLSERMGGLFPVLPLSGLAQAVDESAHIMIVSDRTDHVFSEEDLVFRPQTLVAGVGCRRGVSADEIEAALAAALAGASLHRLSVSAIASATLKSDEAGLIEFSQKFDRPLVFIPDDQIHALEGQIYASEEVRSRVGLPGVCEPAAIAASNGTLVVPKQVHGRVTIAIARVAASGGGPAANGAAK